MRGWACGVVLCLSVFVGSAGAQQFVDYSSKKTISVFATYSNDSSHIFLGRTEGRKLLNVGVGLERRIARNRFAAWGWEVDLLPAVLLRDVYEKQVFTTTYFAGVTPPPESPPGTIQYSGFTPGKCISPGVFTDPLVGSGGLNQIGTLTISNTCSYPWTYGAGLSPLGQVVHFRPAKRLQPYLAANAGFVVFTRAVPVDTATRFNFTFEGGAGFQWYIKPRRSIVFDFRLHHLSNAYISADDPGVDSSVFKVGYTFAR